MKVTISGDDEFITGVKEHIKAIDQAIEDLKKKRTPLVEAVRQYDPLFGVGVVGNFGENGGENTGTQTKGDEGLPNLDEDLSVPTKLPSPHSTEGKILKAFQQGDITFAHHGQVASLLNLETPDNNKNVRRALNSLKEHKHLASYVVLRTHPRTKHLIETPLFGLPTMFSDPEQGILLDEFETKKQSVLQELGFEDKRPNS